MLTSCHDRRYPFEVASDGEKPPMTLTTFKMSPVAARPTPSTRQIRRQISLLEDQRDLGCELLLRVSLSLRDPLRRPEIPKLKITLLGFR